MPARADLVALVDAAILALDACQIAVALARLHLLAEAVRSEVSVGGENAG